MGRPGERVGDRELLELAVALLELGGQLVLLGDGLLELADEVLVAEVHLRELAVGGLEDVLDPRLGLDAHAERLSGILDALAELSDELLDLFGLEPALLGQVLACLGERSALVVAAEHGGQHLGAQGQIAASPQLGRRARRVVVEAHGHGELTRQGPGLGEDLGDLVVGALEEAAFHIATASRARAGVRRPLRRVRGHVLHQRQDPEILEQSDSEGLHRVGADALGEQLSRHGPAQAVLPERGEGELAELVGIDAVSRRRAQREVAQAAGAERTDGSLHGRDLDGSAVPGRVHHAQQLGGERRIAGHQHAQLSHRDLRIRSRPDDRRERLGR